MVELTLRDALLPEEFLDVACTEGPTPTEADRSQQLEEDMAEQLLSMAPRRCTTSPRWGDTRARPDTKLELLLPSLIAVVEDSFAIRPTTARRVRR